MLLLAQVGIQTDKLIAPRLQQFGQAVGIGVLERHRLGLKPCDVIANAADLLLEEQHILIRPGTLASGRLIQNALGKIIGDTGGKVRVIHAGKDQNGRDCAGIAKTLPGGRIHPLKADRHAQEVNLFVKRQRQIGVKPVPLDHRGKVFAGGQPLFNALQGDRGRTRALRFGTLHGGTLHLNDGRRFIDVRTCLGIDRRKQRPNQRDRQNQPASAQKKAQKLFERLDVAHGSGLAIATALRGTILRAVQHHTHQGDATLKQTLASAQVFGSGLGPIGHHQNRVQ